MGLYSKYILPRAVHFTCSSKPNMRQREKVVPLASGEVLEIGVGSGLNFPFYDPSRVTKLWGLEPSAEMRRLAEDVVRSLPFNFEFIDLPGEEIPLDANSVDTVFGHLHTVHDPRNAVRASRNGAGLAPGWKADLLRTRGRARRGGSALAGPPESDLEANGRRVPPQSRDPRTDPIRRFRDRCAGHDVSPGLASGCFQLLGNRVAPLMAARIGGHQRERD